MDKNKLRPIEWTVKVKGSMNPDGKEINETNKGLFHRWMNISNQACAVIEDFSGLVHFVSKDNFTEFVFKDSVNYEKENPKMVY